MSDLSDYRCPACDSRNACGCDQSHNDHDADIVATCNCCGREFDSAEWAALGPGAMWPGALWEERITYTILTKVCPYCSSSISIQVATPQAAVGEAVGHMLFDGAK